MLHSSRTLARPTSTWRFSPLICMLLSLFALTGCGGGGGAGPDAPASSTVTINAAPVNQQVDDGQSAVLNVQASSATTLRYQWLRDGAVIPAATDARYVTPALSLAESGAVYAVVVLDDGGIPKTLSAVVAVKALEPTWVKQPQAKSVGLGQQATFTVQAQGSLPLDYRWQRNGIDIAGATAASYSAPAATADDDGSRYRAIVRNPGGEVVSDEAALQVTGTAPTALVSLQAAVASVGQSVVLFTILPGSAPFTYQWLRNGQPLAAAATSASPEVRLQTPALTAADSGVRYSLVFSSADKIGRSNDAIITVLSAPSLAAGTAHSLARTADGRTVWAWGDNARGQLGAANLASSSSPRVVDGLPTVKALAAGSEHSLALGDDGSVWAWGGNGAGALGDGSLVERATPRRVVGLDSVIAIAAGAGRSFALRADGSLWAWGENTSGALGLGSRSNQPVPAQAGRNVAGFTHILAISAGARHTLALRADGTVFAFGEVAVPLADGIGTQASPVVMAGLPAIAGIAAGDGFSLAVEINGRLWSWGLNGNGQLGSGSQTSSAAPVALEHGPAGSPLLPALGLTAGGAHAVALPILGPALAWGLNGAGQLGTGAARADASLPTGLRAMASPIVSVVAGRTHTLAMLADGTVYAWGANTAGQLGIGSSESARTEPVQVPGLKLR